MAKIPSTRDNKNTKRTVYETVAKDLYPARITRFIGYGMQEQPEWQGEKKDPAFKVAVTYELYDPKTLKPLDVKGVVYENDEATEEVSRPSCVFQDYFLFPGASRGKVLELCQAMEAGIEKAPDDLDWFLERLGAPLQVQVDHYKRKDGSFGTKVINTSGMAAFMANALEPARTDIVGFDPYVETEKMERAYSMLYPFQREILSNALDGKLNNKELNTLIPLAGSEPKKFDEEEKPHSADSTPTAAVNAMANEVAGDDEEDRPF